MQVKITKKIGKSELTFEVEGDKDADALALASGYTTMPDVCGNCGKENLMLDSNKGKNKEGKEFTFVKIKCLDCNYRSNMGQLLSGGIFWKEFEEYKAPEQRQYENK